MLLVSGAGDGPLALSVGLASAAAARGTRTALLECDLASPALAEALGLRPAPGLREYLSEEAEAGEILQSAGPRRARLGRRDRTTDLHRRRRRCRLGSADRLGGLSGTRSAKLRHAYQFVVVYGPPLGDQTGALREAAAGSDAVIACVGPALASGRAGRKLGKALSRLAVPSAGLVVYGGAGLGSEVIAGDVGVEALGVLAPRGVGGSRPSPRRSPASPAPNAGGQRQRGEEKGDHRDDVGGEVKA